MKYRFEGISDDEFKASLEIPDFFENEIEEINSIDCARAGSCNAVEGILFELAQCFEDVLVSDEEPKERKNKVRIFVKNIRDALIKTRKEARLPQEDSLLEAFDEVLKETT